ncbi:MAG: hypothetical protein HFJ27_04940 [Clostridia bacterium]|nr:hypothetical protein [Clostridia bacterium]
MLFKKKQNKDLLINGYIQITKQQQYTINKQDEIISKQNENFKRIIELTEMNKCGNKEVILAKIKELAKIVNE